MVLSNMQTLFNYRHCTVTAVVVAACTQSTYWSRHSCCFIVCPYMNALVCIQVDWATVFLQY